MNTHATRLLTEAHHEVVIGKSLVAAHGALHTVVLDFDPLSPGTFHADVKKVVARASTPSVTSVTVATVVPPPLPSQILKKSYGENFKAWNAHEKATNAENYIQDRRDGSEMNTTYLSCPCALPDSAQYI